MWEHAPLALPLALPLGSRPVKSETYFFVRKNRGVGDSAQPYRERVKSAMWGARRGSTASEEGRSRLGQWQCPFGALGGARAARKCSGGAQSVGSLVSSVGVHREGGPHCGLCCSDPSSAERGGACLPASPHEGSRVWGLAAAAVAVQKMMLSCRRRRRGRRRRRRGRRSSCPRAARRRRNRRPQRRP